MSIFLISESSSMKLTDFATRLGGVVGILSGLGLGLVLGLLGL